MIAVVFFVFVFGIMESGRLMFAYDIVAKASREGVRYAAVRGDRSGRAASSDDIKSYVANRSLGRLTTSAVDVSWPDGGSPSNAPGKRVQVQTRYTFQTIVPLLPQRLLTFTSTATEIIAR